MRELSNSQALLGKKREDVDRAFRWLLYVMVQGGGGGGWHAQRADTNAHTSTTQGKTLLECELAYW